LAGVRAVSENRASLRDDPLDLLRREHVLDDDIAFLGELSSVGIRQRHGHAGIKELRGQAASVSGVRAMHTSESPTGGRTTRSARARAGTRRLTRRYWVGGMILLRTCFYMTRLT